MAYRISIKGASGRFYMENLETGDKAEPYPQSYIMAKEHSNGNIMVLTAMGAGDGRPFPFSRSTGIPYTEFRDGNNSDATFASAQAVLDWFDDNTGDFKKAGRTAPKTVSDYTALSALRNPRDGDTAIVTDEGIGGTFVYDSTLSATDNGGTIIDGWVRQWGGDVMSNWWVGSNGAVLQKSIDYVESIGGGSLMVNNKYYISDQNINISGAVDFILKGVNSSTIIRFETGDYGIIVGNETTTTNNKVKFENLHISDSDGGSTLVKIINHVYFTMTDSRLSGGLNGLDIYATGTGNYSWKINVDKCSISTNSNAGVYIHNENDAQFMNDVVISNSYIAINGVGVKVDGNVNGIQGVALNNCYLDNADDTTKLLTIEGNVISARFNSVTFDGQLTGVDMIDIASEVGPNVSFNMCYFDCNINNLSKYTVFQINDQLKDISSSTILNTDHIFKTLSTTTNVMITIPLDFKYWPINKIQEFAVNGHVLTIKAPIGVTINGVDNGYLFLGDGDSFVKKSIQKTGANTYILYNEDVPYSGELINGTFVYDVVWGKDAGWTINTSTNSADCDGTQTANSYLQQFTLSPNSSYEYTATVSNYVSGDVRLGSTGDYGADIVANGVYTRTFTTDGSGRFGVLANLDFVGSVSNITVTKL